MELTVHGKQIDVGDALRTHVTEKLSDINEKYFNRAAYGTVTFSREGHGKKQTKTNILIQVGRNIQVVADALETDPYASFDAAASKIGTQLRRYKRKLRDHHERMSEAGEQDTTVQASYYTLAGEGDAAGEEQPDMPAVIAEMTTDIETISVSEAVMRMDLAHKSALLFRNASHNGLNMVYRRPDGNVGWIDPEGLAVKKKKSA